MPSLRPFRNNSKKNHEDIELQQQLQEDFEQRNNGKSSLRNLFGKRKHSHKNKGDPVMASSSLMKEPLTIECHPGDEAAMDEVPGMIASPTEHTVTSVGSDVTSSSDNESVEVYPQTAKKTTDLSIASPTERTIQAVGSDVSANEDFVEVTAKFEAPKVDEVACYLVYEPDSSGRLVEHYSKSPVEGAVGRWVPSGGKKIAPFKLTRNAGRNVLIGNCSAGVQGRKNYCNGWCQFVKSCKILRGDVTLYNVPEGVKAMPVDVYLYYDDARPSHQTIRLEPGVACTTDKLLAVACIPKNTTFFENMTVDLMKWLQDARNHGYSTKI
mmetsp:Transcript_15299/g.26558  ORF Transcript_15299/g.26558 Transcript_15299/m.26558 type:complete len:325 (+) Transcript_15299:181-1155(+)